MSLMNSHKVPDSLSKLRYAREQIHSLFLKLPGAVYVFSCGRGQMKLQTNIRIVRMQQRVCPGGITEYQVVIIFNVLIFAPNS